MTASSPTDRRDADDATFAAELARLDGLEVADVAADVRDQADALLSRTRAHMAWRGSRGGSLLSEDFAFLAGWDAARTAMFDALKPAPGTERDHEARAREVLLPEVFAAERDRFAAPGTDAKGICQAFTGCVNALDRHNSRCPAAPGTDSRDSLREAIARALFGRAHGGWPGSLEAADEVLALLRRDLSAETGPVARQSCGCEGYRVHHHGCTKFAAPGTDTPGQAVQRVLDLADDLEAEANRCSSVEARISLRDAANRARDAVAGPQRDHGEV